MIDRTHSPRLTLERLTKLYDGQAVVDNLSLDLEGGRIHCLLGPNGAGKTTTMHMLMGLRAPSSGEIWINGVNTRDPGIHIARREVGFLADQPDHYEDLTGREFLHFLSVLYEEPDALTRLTPRIEGLGLAEQLDHPLRVCSLGVRKKVGLLAALVHSPSVLVLDEPTGALDAHAARAVKDLLIEMREEHRLVLFSTHIMEIAETLADTISIIHLGRIVFSGELVELRARHGRHAGERLEDIFLRLTAAGAPAHPAPDERDGRMVVV